MDTSNRTFIEFVKSVWKVSVGLRLEILSPIKTPMELITSVSE